MVHRLWRITDRDLIDALVQGLADVTAVLADGHHRLAAARRLARDLDDAPSGSGHTLAMVLDATHEGPRLRAVHRLVRWTREDLPDRLAEMDGVSVERWPGSASDLAAELERPGPRRFGVVTTTGTWLVALHNGTGEPLLVDLGIPDVLRQLDMVVLREVLFPVMGVVDDRSHRVLDYDKAASAVFTEPEIADVGLAEADAFAEGRKIRVTKVPFSASAKAIINDDPRGFIKIVSDPATGVVLGGSIVGRHAAELIAIVALAVTAGLTVHDIQESLFVHPTLAEALADAAE